MRDMGPYFFLAVSLRFYIRVKVVFPSGLVEQNSPANAGDWTLGQEDLLQKERATHSSILAGKIPRQRNLAGHSPWGCKAVRYNLAIKQQSWSC